MILTKGQIMMIQNMVNTELSNKNTVYSPTELVKLKEALRKADVVEQSEQLPCNCGVKLKETKIQVFCPKCYKTWKIK